MDALQAEDDIERGVLSNILLFCTHLTFDLILSHRDISDLAYIPIGLTTHIGTYLASM